MPVKQSELCLNIADTLRDLPTGELHKLSRSKFEVADDFLRLALDFDSKEPSWEMWAQLFDLVDETKSINAVVQHYVTYLTLRTAAEQEKLSALKPL